MTASQDQGYWPERGYAEWEREQEEEAFYGRAVPVPYPEWRTAVERATPRESARRRKLFAKAANALAVMSALRGRKLQPQSYYLRTGRRAGLTVRWDADHDMRWTPRGGYRLIEVEDIPF